MSILRQCIKVKGSSVLFMRECELLPLLLCHMDDIEMCDVLLIFEKYKKNYIYQSTVKLCKMSSSVSIF